MADSDDYFDDFFELDEAALASIQATEERFGASLSQPPSSRPEPPPSPPPMKKLKTATGWVKPVTDRGGAQAALRRTESVDHNPEIVVGADGTYALNVRSASAHGRVHMEVGKTSNGCVELSATSRFQQSAMVDARKSSPSSPTVSSGPSNVPVLPPAVRPHLQRSSSSSHPGLSFQYPPVARSSQSQLRVPPPKANLVCRAQAHGVQGTHDSSTPTASQMRIRVIEQALTEVSAEAQYQAAPPPSISDPQSICRLPAPALDSGPSSTLQVELNTLRAQLAEEKMNAAHAAAQQSLLEAQEDQFAKAGEVSNLRRIIDKTTREHMEAMARARVDKEAAEKARAELQAKLKEETDRMATRLMFKQHEMETSTRKPTWGSARSRRIAKDLPPPSSTVAATPTRSRAKFPSPSINHARRQTLQVIGTRQNQDGSENQFSSPTSVPKRVRRSEELQKPTFRGFQNAFMDSGPVAPRSPRKDKSKQIEEDDGVFGPSVAEHDVDVEMMHASPIKRDKGKRRGMHEQSESSSAGDVGGHDGMATITSESDVPNMTPMDVDASVVEEEMNLEEGIDWGEELRRIVFTHTAPRSDSLTLHAILSTSLPSETSSRKKQAYTSACQTILETCGAKHGHAHYPEDSEWEAVVVDKVASAFVTISGLLSDTGCLTPLAALLDLLTLLTLYIPAFLSPFLGPAASNEILDRELDPDGPSQLLSVLGDIVQDHLSPLRPERPDEEGKEIDQPCLAMAVVQLMECVCWNVKDGLVEQLGLIARRSPLLEILLHPSKAPALIVRTVRLLVLLATHKPMFRPLLSFPEVGNAESAPAKDWSRIPLIERLCQYLVDPPAEESHPIRRLIISFISLLSDTNTDALTIVLDSVSLIPSLVVCVTKLSRLIWEDNLIGSSEVAKSTIETLYLSIKLLHHLVFAPNSSANLGRKLIDATRLPGPFNGVTHLFIVTFGRLSWAETPEWLDDDCRDSCDIIAELAMELIETIVAGPECDSLWAVWQQEEEINDEEAEAWLVEMD